MRKGRELAITSSCLNRAKDDEMLFVLMGRDVAAVATVRFWIEERIRLSKNTADDPQIKEARVWIGIVEKEQRAGVA